MLVQDYTANSEAELREPRTFYFRVSYPSQLVYKVNGALHFVIRKIGFKPAEEFVCLGGSDQLKLWDTNGNNLVIDLKIIEKPLHGQTIIFHTDDCLRDYHRYIISGVEFLNRPEYNEAGLQVKFMDDEDNCYTLLEERTYTES